MAMSNILYNNIHNNKLSKQHLLFCVLWYYYLELVLYNLMHSSKGRQKQTKKVLPSETLPPINLKLYIFKC